MKYLDKVKFGYKMYKLKKEIQAEQKEIDRLGELIASRKKEMLGFAHRIGCYNIHSEHIEYLFDNVDIYSSRVNMVNWIMEKHIEIGLRKDAILLGEEGMPVVSGYGFS